MKQYDKQLASQEKKLIREIGQMKFSFKKLLKVIELDALINYSCK